MPPGVKIAENKPKAKPNQFPPGAGFKYAGAKEGEYDPTKKEAARAAPGQGQEGGDKAAAGDAAQGQEGGAPGGDAAKGDGK